MFVGTILAGILGLVGSLYFQAYYASDAMKDQGVYEVSRPALALFLTFNVAFCYGLREIVREVFERRWKAGIGLKRVLIAGASDLGRMVADKVLEHREFGFKIVGFLDDRASGDHIGYRGLPLLGTLAEADEIIRQEKIDHVYVALPLDEHVKMLGVVEATNREGVDVHVVPDLLQFIALRARLENLDGVPIISLNDVPLRGFNSLLKRGIDFAISGSALLGLALPFLTIMALIRYTSKGPIFYKQERMGLDGKAFDVYKFRSMYRGRRGRDRPDLGARQRPALHAGGHAGSAASTSTSCRSSGTSSAATCRSSARGPSGRIFVEQFKHRIPQYMLRHKVKAGITGWAQVNGWRGNTSIEKRIEFDLYYIENWSVGLDIKIMWLTVLRGLQKMRTDRSAVQLSEPVSQCWLNR